ncbi:3-oxoacyl-[acyl-carrier-protein] synthase III C-terminal domain-containing protein [Streptomyces sp. UNOC14_S4]|uniref:3-oxoacyl-ACP synthase III family protein n=1 Tax=Streptomyces sp. UNOC14_S4 TaxID=2872340 RepID=UPI001E53B239|nr:3-oxoacyl-[acyl-carrier-protein] synthase III C-terminal domain-containing protein [Streptomyces sp. UNOC14_S4]MCC3766360.1 ketoacyl-ACP synthase III [Streptomyces sp. UNOC14_S4]
MSELRACLTGVTAHLPERWVPMAEREAQIAAASPDFVPPPGLITQLTGVEGVHLIADDQQASDLAASAARKLLAECGTRPEDIDLMMFAAASQDMLEPATSHIVAAKLGLNCPVFDVKNACNSVLNAIELTQALIASGRYRRVLIACGEAPSLTSPLCVPDAASFVRAFPSYGFSDAGAAMLWTAEEGTDRGVLGSRFAAESTAWASASVPFGGTARRGQTGVDAGHFRMDSTRMRESMNTLFHTRVLSLLDELGLTAADFAFVGIHQVALADLDAVCGGDFGVSREQLVLTLPRHGNVASASLPLQLSRALESGLAHPGDLVALTGLAAGSSAGLTVIRL